LNEAFSTTWLSNCCRFPWGCPGKPDRENGHRTFSGFRRLAPGIPGAWTLVYVGGAALVTSATTSAPIFLPSLALTFASLVSVSGGVYSPMGWQQYSRPLWLSRGNHYILYLKAMTAQMRVWWTGFPQLRPSRARLHGELHFLDRGVHCSMSISAGPDLLFRLTQDFRPWLLSVAPLGWCLVVLSLFVCAVCSIDPALPIRAISELAPRTDSALLCSVPGRGVRAACALRCACGASLS
jgi:hypothetical protein